MAEYALIILALPLISWLVIGLLGQRINRNGDWIGIAAVSLAFLLSLGVLADVIGGAAESWRFNWAIHGTNDIELGFQVDPLTAVMLVVVTLVSMMVQIYSLGYMHGDVRYKRYYATLSLFTFSMLGLVLADNFLLLFIFWELVGLCSYLLIGHWYEKKDVSNAAIKAFITTRIGDIGLLIGIFILFAAAGTFGFNELAEMAEHGEIAAGTLTLAAILVFSGAVGKSAQFPLHVWLPDAMAGPTPVSALIHAATMVAAGVYLVARSYALFEFSPDAMLVVAIIGAFTAFFAATMGLVMTDIKKVLAYSTVSQLGYMMLGLGVGGYTAGVFHLTTHAFFKALLFLCSGSVIHAAGTQEMHQMGGLYGKMKTTAWTWIIGAAALAGIPPLAGFWSKDEILLSAYRSDYPILYWIGLAAAFMTAFYITRATILTFFGKPRDKHVYEHAHESPKNMTYPLIVLAFLAVTAGFLGSPLLDYAFGKFVYFGHPHELEASAMVQILAILAGLSGIFLGWLIYGSGLVDRARYLEDIRPLWNLLKNKYYIDEIYGWVFVKGTVALSWLVGKFDALVVDGIVNAVGKGTVKASEAVGDFDLAVVDGAVNGVAETVSYGSKLFRRLQTGYVQSYALTLFLAVVVGLIIFVIG